MNVHVVAAKYRGIIHPSDLDDRKDIYSWTEFVSFKAAEKFLAEQFFDDSDYGIYIKLNNKWNKIRRINGEMTFVNLNK